jgi:L-fucose isomerase-like protein
MMQQKTALAVIVSNRNFFADSLVGEGRKEILAVLSQMGVETVILDEKTTKLGAVETWADSQKCAQLFKENRDKIGGILVTLPNFGDEKGVADAIRLSGLDVPILVHAFPDKTTALTGAERRDAYCGKLSVCNNLYQYGYAFSTTRRHTLGPRTEEFRNEITRFLQMCRVVNGMRSLRLGAIGARPDAFKTVRFSEKLLEASGISVSTVDLSEMIAGAQKLADDDGRVRAKIDDIKSYTRTAGAPAPSLLKMAKLGIVISDWMTANSIDATAFQCWNSIQQNYGINACTLMSMMSDRLLPSACEVDVCGVAGMVALQLASGTPSALVDWNNNYDDEPDKLLLFHCGNWPKSLVKDIKMGTAEILGSTLGPDNTWGAVYGRPAAGPVTFARLDTDDSLGTIRAAVAEGAFTDDPISEMLGMRAVVHLPGLDSLMRYLCLNGHAHHCAINGSLVGGILAEAFETYLGWDVYHHQG